MKKMKKRITSLLLTMVILLAASVTAFAASPKLGFDSSYDADTGFVSVNVFISNALDIESGDLEIAFDSKKLTFVESSEGAGNNAIVFGGLSVVESDVCTCSFIFMDKCVQDDLDENGNLALATYKFKPINGEYDDDDFSFWAQSLVLSGNDIADKIEVVGNKKLSENRAGGVVVDRKDIDNNSDPKESRSNWSVYVIAVVLALAAIVGIAFVAMKSGENKSGKDDINTESAD